MFTDELLLSLLLCNPLTHNFSSCSGRTGLTQVIIAYSQPVIIKTDISWSGFPVGVCVCVLGRWGSGGCSHQKELYYDHSSVCSILNPTPAEMLTIISEGQKQICIASARLCLPLESQSRHELVRARNQPLCLLSPGAFASWISFHPTASQLYFTCQFPQFFCWYINKDPFFSVSFNKQSVQAFLAVGEEASGGHRRWRSRFLCLSVGSNVLSWHCFYFTE